MTNTDPRSAVLAEFAMNSPFYDWVEKSYMNIAVFFLSLRVNQIHLQVDASKFPKSSYLLKLNSCSGCI